MARKWLDADISGKTKELTAKAAEYHQRFYSTEVFGGPSLHFHRRALGLHGRVSAAEQIELTYAVLTSWGMHRMGGSGSKMRAFAHFESTVHLVKPHLARLRGLRHTDLDEQSWSALEQVFRGIQVMRSGATLVGNSKVLAHLLPNLVAPIDREYTLAFLFGGKLFPNGLDHEWRLMRKVLSEFFYPVAGSAAFARQATEWMSNSDAHPWDTSVLKVVDNLVIGAKRSAAQSTTAGDEVAPPG